MTALEADNLRSDSVACLEQATEGWGASSTLVAHGAVVTLVLRGSVDAAISLAHPGMGICLVATRLAASEFSGQPACHGRRKSPARPPAKRIGAWLMKIVRLRDLPPSGAQSADTRRASSPRGPAESWPDHRSPGAGWPSPRIRMARCLIRHEADVILDSHTPSLGSTSDPRLPPATGPA